MVGQHLKQADKFLLQHNFEAAERAVKKALEEEPNNIYARAYRERIDTLRKEYLARREREEDQQRIEELKRQSEPPPEPRHPPQPKQAAPAAPPKALEAFRDQLYQCWHDGVLSPREQAHLEQERKRLNISPSQRAQMEREVKMNCYVEALEKSIQRWSAPVKPDALEELRKKFGVSLEEHLSIEGRILWELQHKRTQAAILVIDDEADLLSAMSEGLASQGYTVLTAEKPEDAMEILENNTPDLIICDIRFDGSPLDGFSIYRKVRAKRELVMVPFVFITGVKDEWVHKQGLEIGADDFLIKPFTMTTILSVVEGKLHRYEELKKALR